MIYIVSVITDKASYLSAVTNKTRKTALNKVFENSLFVYYDSVKRITSAPVNLNLLFLLCRNNGTDCKFKVTNVSNDTESYKKYVLDTGYDLVYIPAYCFTSMARITKYRYTVLSKICDETDTVKQIRLFDTVTRKELVQSVENIYKMHTSDMGSHVNVIANLRISQTQHGYKVSAISGNIPIERAVKNSTDVSKNASTKTVYTNKFKIDYVNEGKTVLSGINLNYDWESDQSNELELPAVTYVAMDGIAANAACCDALRNIKVLKIPASIQKMKFEFLCAMPNLKKIVSENKNYGFSDEMQALYQPNEKRLCYILNDKNCKEYEVRDNYTIGSYAFCLSNVTSVTLGNGAKVERTAFADSNVSKLIIGKNVTFMAGCFRGMNKLKQIEIDEELSDELVQQLLDINQWRGLEEYNIKTQKFEGKTPHSVEFVGKNAPNTITMINAMLAIK